MKLCGLCGIEKYVLYIMSLESIVDNSRTDKNTIHSYLPLYQKLFGSKQETAKSILEIGIWNGGSIKLWHDFFQMQPYMDWILSTLVQNGTIS